MGAMIDLKGFRFGKWTVIEKAASPPGNEAKAFWLCRCDCGTEAVRRGVQLRYAEKRGVRQSCQSCGAIDSQTKHGLSKTPEYKVWAAMLDRCKNPEHHAFARYGGRGITVCDRWKDSFENFLSDMGKRQSSAESLDRIDNNGPYDPENCRWTDSKTQNRNTSRVVDLTLKGRTQSIAGWAEELGISHAVIWHRLNKLGWSVEDALTIKHGKAYNWRGTLHKDAAQYEFNGQSKSLTEWAQELGVRRATLATRLKRGWSAEKTFSQ